MLAIIAFVVVVFLLYAIYKETKSNASNPSTTIHLRHTKAYASESKKNIYKGLLWSLSQVGASLPSSTTKQGLQNVNDTLWIVDFSQLGFDEKALSVWKQLIAKAKQSEEYRKYGAVMLNRFMIYAVYATKHYYELTAVPKTYAEFSDSANKAKKWLEFAVDISSVSKESRVIRLEANPDNIVGQKFIAMEGTGTFKTGNFKHEIYEVFDVMPNGQLRYIIYNKDGNLLDASPLTYGEAGKPAKCMWCHESYVQELFMKTPDIFGYIGKQTFLERVNRANEQLKVYRKALSTAIDYSNRKDHELAEIMYISYMEPSAETLAFEWKISVDEVRMRLAKLPTHKHHEFPFLGELYHRNEIEKFTLVKSIPIPSSIREPNGLEPNVLTR